MSMNKKIYEIIHNDELNILEDKTNDTYQSKEMIESDFDLTLYFVLKVD